MQDFKKVLLSIVVTILMFISTSIVFLMYTSQFTHNFDWCLREELSGSLDFLIAGASQGQCAFYTKEIDDVTGNNCYNLSYDSETNYEKEYLLKKELARNKIKTVVLELSYDTLQFSNISPYTDANIFSIMRMDTFKDQAKYYINNIDSQNKLYVYANMMIEGIKGLSVHKNTISAKERELKGSETTGSYDYRLKPIEAINEHNINIYSISLFKKETIDNFTKLIDLCKSYDCRTIVAVTPVSDNYIWCNDNLDEFNEWAKKYCIDNNVEYYDFNLLKDRYILFSDEDCYGTDTRHMSKKGSKIFSNVFANTIQKSENGKDVSDLFYQSYIDMKADSPYMVYLH